MTVSPSTSDEVDAAPELFPCVAAIASTFGDPTGKYVSFLQAGDSGYADDAYFLWSQPLAGGDSTPTSQTGQSESTGKVASANGAIDFSAGNDYFFLLATLMLFFSLFWGNVSWDYVDA